MKRAIALAMALLCIASLFGCGTKEVSADADETIEATTTLEATTEELSESTSTEPTTEEATITSTALTTTSIKTTTTKQEDFPKVQLKQSPKTYENDSWLSTRANNYYGEANVGSTLQFGGSAFPGISINIPVNTKMGTKAGDDVSYSLFITKDGTLTIRYFSEGAFSTLKYSIFNASVNGNDVTFKAGKIVDPNEFELNVKVSGFFLVEAYAEFGTDEGMNGHSTLKPSLVLSEKEVDEFFATGKIAKYGNFDFSGLNDVIQAK